MIQRFQVEDNDLVWDSGYGEVSAVITAQVLWDSEKEEIIDIEEIYFGWVDQDGGDHESDDETFCDKVIIHYIKSNPEKYDKDFNEEEYLAEIETESRIDAERDDKLTRED